MGGGADWEAGGRVERGSLFGLGMNAIGKCNRNATHDWKNPRGVWSTDGMCEVDATLVTKKKWGLGYAEKEGSSDNNISREKRDVGKKLLIVENIRIPIGS